MDHCQSGQGIYTTAFKDIVGFGDFEAIFRILNLFFTDLAEEDFKNRVLIELCLRTERATKKSLWALKKSVLYFLNDDHKALCKCFFSNEKVPLQDKRLFFLWHLSLNDRLVKQITAQVFCPAYFSGRAAIKPDDVLGFLKKMNEEQEDFPDWSESTFYRLATKYLNLMVKLNFIESGRLKSFKHIKLSSEAQVLFLYFAKLYSPESSNILENELLPESFISLEDLKVRVKKLSLKGFFNMDYDGVKLNIELTHDYKGICDVLYY